MLKKNFNKLWDKIKKSIKKDGYFVGNIFGINDEWNTNINDMTFLDKDEIHKILKDFKIINLKEKEFDGETAIGIKKHWHIFFIIAQKLN